MIAGRYSLDREIGRGGMGAVYLGSDNVLGRQVAIKRVGAMPGGSSPDLERAEREARIAAQLNHPHVVAIFDLVHDDDQQYLVMEYVEGTTLAELVRSNGSLTPDDAAPLLAQASEALAAAHAAGIVHRDVKPSNMLVTPDGQVKLSDFGIARAEADASLTQTGLVTGSPAYLAPEVATGKQATTSSDVWSLGATLFHALAGRPPYDAGENVLGALYQIVHEAPPRLDNAGWLTPMLEATMTQEPGDRWSMSRVSEFLHAGPEAAAAAAAVVPAPTPEPEATGTQVMSQVTPPAAPAPPVEEPRPAPEPQQPKQPKQPKQRTGGKPAAFLPFLIGAAAVALIVIIVLAVTLGDEDDPADPTAQDPLSSQSQSQSQSGEEPSPSTSTSTSPPAPAPSEPVAEDMEAFASDYVQTASSDPDSGFQLLTPAYQAESGNLSGYTDYWDNLKNPQVQSVEADPGALTVTYTYNYNYTGRGPVTETVTLLLAFDDGEYLIADQL